MDEDLKIVVTSELEADEQASAQRISAQLPSIAKLINQQSKIKVRVEVDNSNIQTEAQKFSKELSRATQTHKVGVSVGLDQASVRKMQAELNSLKVSPDVSHAMTEQLEKMGIQIDRITGRWEQASNQEERMLSLSIQGTDQLGRSVSYLQTYDAITGDINTHLTNVTMNLERQRQIEAQIAAKAKADNESRISYLTKQKAVLSDIQASYTGATSAKPVNDTTHLDALNAKYAELETKIQTMIGTTGQLDKVQRASIEAEIAALKQLVKEYQNAEYVATKLRTKDIGSIKTDQFAALDTLEKRLQSAGTLTDEFKSRISGLRTQLGEAFDPASLTAFLNSFDRLEGDVKTFQEQLRGVNALYTQMIAVENKVTRTKTAMVGLDPTADKEKLAVLNEQLALYERQRQMLNEQLTPYAAIIQYARQAESAERARLENEIKLKLSGAELADKAREIDQTMQRIPSTVQDLQMRFSQLVAPTDNLIQKMQMLRETEAAYSSAKTDAEKIAAYERLQFLIAECSKEMSELNRVQRGDVLNFKFNENLEKAKADLAAVGRQWSALKSDPGLNAQFQQLGYNLQVIDNQMDLNKWTSQFSRFKSEVKAAGKNMQSLGDVLKNNVGKVLQWVSATTLLFRAFSILRNAISTVVALDTAMIDLRKTTQATEEEYRKFYLSANETAKALGVTTEEVISQTAEWSRLGYTMQEAAKLAENSAIFRAVSPEMDIDMATDGLVSIIKAFDIDVDDTMDGIISKVNSVGNAFAVSNADIVEALTRSSAAMSAANNTFDETVALATAAIEITRDASSVGNALKTISMRIRGYDEETEEYVGGVEELTGAIADLTKTASNNNRGISLFEEGDPETYRSTYDILADIAAIWDELTDKNRADLLDKLFGKQRAQVGAAMLANFEQADAAIKTMANSAGSAEAEMENIYQSLDYKLNALQETWVGVAQNLFDTDQMKLVVDGLTALSNAVDWLTDKLGLFGTIGLVVVIGHLVKFRSTLSTINTAITPVLNTLSNISFDGSTSSVLSYALALSSLEPTQQRLAMSMAGLNAEQQQQVITMMTAVAAMKQYTVAELEKTLGMEAGTLANELNVASTERVTVEILKAAVANGTLTQAQMEQILMTNRQAAANNTAGLSFKNLGATAGAAWKSMSALSKFSLIAGVVTTAISLISAAWTYFSERAERAKQKMEELENEYEELASTISSTATTFRNLRNTSEEIIPRFVELAKGVDKFGKNVSLTDEEYEEFLSLNNQIAEMFPEINMGMDSNGNAMLALSYSADTLTESLMALVEAERAAANAEIAKTMPDVLTNIEETNEVYRDQIADLRDIQDEYTQVFEDIQNRSLPTEVGRFSTKEAGEAAAREFIQKAQELGMHGSVYIDDQQSTNNGYVFKVEWDYSALDVAPTLNMPYIEDQYEIAIQRYEQQINNFEERMRAKWAQLNPVVGSWLQTDFMFQDLNGQMQEIAETMVSGLDFSELGLTTQEEVQQYVDDNIVEPLFLAAPEVKEAFNSIVDWKEQLANGEITNEDFASNIREAFDGIFASLQPANAEAFKNIFTTAFNEMGIAGSDFNSVLDGLIDEWAGNTSGAQQFSGELSELSETLSALKSSYDLLEQAQEDMATGGLTAETIEALANAEEDYLSYLYEENGVVKLNIEAWKEKANAQMAGDIALIESEISAIEQQNAALRENIAYYEEQRSLGNDGGLWSSLIAEATSEIEANNAAIAEHQKKLAMYSVLYGDITGDVDAYTAALHNFTNVANSIDSISSSFQTLADLQATVADGFTMSLEKALEFAAVYPEILNNAQVTADGQIALNEGVVNTFIQGKKAELDTQIDAQIAQLEADKAVLEAKMQAAQAQLDLAKSVGEGEGQISKELAEYRINAGNAVAQALIDAGIDEATAFKLAAAAMSQNAQEFNQIAADVCTDVNGNFNQAAYDLAQTMYNNLTNVKTDLASVAKQAHQTAQAIAGIADGSVAGSSTVQGGSGGGTTGNGIKINLTSGNFEGTEYTYEAKEIGLDDFIADLELDISTYEDAIAQIDGQIATLQALKNIPLKEFKSDSGSDSGSGSDEVEEYIADIDKYREAVERLRKAQELVSDIELKIEDSDNIKEKILLTRQLIGAYEREQDALHDLNNERDATIQAGVESLRELGFAVEYNADTNDLWISNMEHLNELTADSVGSYGSMQEATNALREDTEGLIDTITELNEENREGSESWKEVESGIKSLREQITDYLSEIVQEASDSVDSIQSVYDTLHDAADEYASSGYITVDTLQSIIGLGQQYLAYLMDENGQLVINEESIKKVIAARTQQMAIESSLAYVEALRMAKAEGDIATLNNLLYATEQATNATWGFVYANLALAGLDDAQYQAALQNINALRSLAESAVQSIGQTVGGVTEELEEMQNGLNDILDYVMDMLKQRIQDQIDGLEDMKDAYSEIIELKKESLEASKDEADYQKTMASKMREIAKLQARIDALSLDDSREAQAEKAALLEEMSELQQELADDQADRTLEAQEDALDKMEEAYHEEKDKEIEILEDSISSYQKLYDMAIEYIESHWDTLYSELISWNTQYGDVLNSEITSAWDNCLAAAQRYGSYVSALNSIGGDIEASQSSGTNIQVGNTNYDNSSSNEDMVHAIIKEMYANSRQHGSEDEAGKAYLNKRNLVLGAQLAQYGITAVRGNDGVWYVDRVGGELLYDKYKKYIYHKGGIVGGGDLKSNEQISLLKTKEWVLSEQMVDNLTAQMDRINLLSEALSDLPDYAGNSTFADVMKQVAGSKTVNNVTNNSKPIELQIGDTTIYGADQSTVKEHIKITRDMVNQIGRIIGIGR